MAKVETTLTLEQLDAALKLNGSLRAFDAGYAKGFAAGLEAGAEMADKHASLRNQQISCYAPCNSFGTGAREIEIGARDAATTIAATLRERAREEKSGKPIEREGK